MSADFELEGVRHEYRPGLPALAAIDLTILSGQHVAIAVSYTHLTLPTNREV